MQVFVLLPHRSSSRVNLLLDGFGLNKCHSRVVAPEKKAASTLLGLSSLSGNGYFATLCSGNPYPHASEKVIRKSVLKSVPGAFIQFGQKATTLENFFITDMYDEATEKDIFVGEYQST